MTHAEIQAVLGALLPDHEAADLGGLASRLPDPGGALLSLRRLIESGIRAPDAARLRNFLVLAGSSPFLGRLLSQNPEFLEGLPAAGTGIRLRTREDLEEDFARFRFLHGSQDISTVLRRFRDREYPRIALADFLGSADLPAVTRALSLLADTLLDQAVRSVRALLEERHGRPTWRDDRGTLAESGFAVLALGKLGGEELNYSSDIDLLYLYERDGETGGVGLEGRDAIPNREFFARLAAGATALIAGRGPAGQVFRVDLGLRPGGKDGDLVVSLGSAVAYYRTWAEPWERQALIKARPAAGSIELGRRFLELVRPLVFAERTDPYLPLEIAAMKDRIDAQLARTGRSESDIKLGRGGIREIEFAVQALQLLHGGSDPWLQQGNTLLALHRLADKGFLGAGEHAAIAAAYVFLRHLEHRLQLGQDRQTAVLPVRGDEWDRLARRLPPGVLAGDRPAEGLRAALEEHRDTVRRFYDTVFGRAAQGTLDAGGPDFWLDRMDDTTLLERLRSAGAPDPAVALRPIRMIRRLLRPAATPEVRRAILRTGQDLLEVAGRSLNARRAFASLEKLLSTLVADPPALARFLGRREIVAPTVRLLGQSDLLGALFIRHPGLLEDLADRGRVLRTPDVALYGERLRQAVDAEPEARGRADALRRAQSREIATIAVRDLNGQATLRESLKSQTDLADATLGVALDLAAANAAGAPIAVLGLGRLGYREIDFGSDLDLVFACAPDDDAIAETLAACRPICERVVRILATLSRDGQLYKVDLRLRPSGREGDILATRAALEAYFRRDAEVWELQSFLKARAVAGDMVLGEALVADLEAIAIDRARTLGPERLAARVDAMRARLQAGVPPENLKIGPGGILDIHFIIEYLQLAHGDPGPPDKDTLRLLTHLHRLGRLDEGSLRTLYEAYLFLRAVDHRMRLIDDRPLTKLPSDPSRLAEIASALGTDAGGGEEGARFVETLAGIRSGVSDVYRRVIAADRSGTPRGPLSGP